MSILKRMKIGYNAPVILTYTALACVALILGYLSGGSVTRHFFTLYPVFSFQPIQLLRMFSYVLGHADFNHFFGNFSLILLIGPLIEEKYGSRKLVVMLLLTAFTSAVIHVLIFNTAVLGASGIVFMLILLTPFTNMQSGKIPLTFILVAAIYMGRELFLGMTVTDHVSRFGHLLGGVIGACSGYFMNKSSRS